MAEYTNSVVQTVIANNNVTFDTEIIDGCNCIYHRAGSGIVTLGAKCTNKCKQRFLVSFSGNIAIPTGGTIGEISLGVSIDGEPITALIMAVTPTAVGAYNNVAVSGYVEVPKCIGSLTIAVENTSGQSILVANPNLSIVKAGK